MANLQPSDPSFVSPESCGAAGDGVADDTAKLQEAANVPIYNSIT